MNKKKCGNAEKEIIILETNNLHFNHNFTKYTITFKNKVNYKP